VAVKFDLVNNAGEGSDSVGVYTNGAAPTVPADRLPDRAEGLLVGVRPEKIQLRPADSEPAAGENRLTGGVVADASFTGVSTQYLVRLPWGQHAVVFAQNMGLGERFPSGTPAALTWDVEHTFALAGDPSAGVRPEDPVLDLRDRSDSGATPLGVVAG
jgi:spermidine/putrescine transport system ATP-binding protein